MTMPDPSTNFRLIAAAVAVALPLISLALILILTRTRPRLSAGVSISAIGVSMVLAMVLLIRDWHLETPVQVAWKWLAAGPFVLPFGFLFDPLNLLMFALVSVISLLVQIYSLGYMKGDPGFSRYYAFQSLFAWSMLSMTLSSSLLQLYVFWELVGLSSYFLIGFWYERFSATQAGKKAFVMTRLGDTGFLIGLLLLLAHVGNLSILDLTSPSVSSGLSQGFVTLTAILIFCAVIGKSAQFPLLTWLPDAMEGPTPVSALLHSATMVAAGVYLFARLLPFFSLSPVAMTVFLAVGTISMLMASTMAMVQRDIKQVWAYSTISQLGMMVMGLGAGGFFASVFHLTTHAGFKALLFLCSGVWIHHFATNDVFAIAARGGRKYRIPMACLVVGGAALAGLPPFSGFFSKEAILGSLGGLSNPIWLGAGLLGAFLTSYYTFRMVFILLFQEIVGAGGWRQKNAKPLPQTSNPDVHRTGFAEHGRPAPGACGRHPPARLLPGTSREIPRAPCSRKRKGKPFLLGRYAALAVSLFGVFISWLEFGRRGAAQVGFVERMPALSRFFSERWYLDRIYRRVVRTVLDGVLAGLSWGNERLVIDRSIDRFCLFTLRGGRRSSFLQSGLLRHNLVFMFAVLIFVALYFSLS